MANWKNPKNRKDKTIYLSEESRRIYSELIKKGIRVSEKIEDFIVELGKKELE